MISDTGSWSAYEYTSFCSSPFTGLKNKPHKTARFEHLLEKANCTRTFGFCYVEHHHSVMKKSCQEEEQTQCFRWQSVCSSGVCISDSQLYAFWCKWPSLFLLLDKLMKVILEHQMSFKIIFKVEDVIGRDFLHITTHHGIIYWVIHQQKSILWAVYSPHFHWRRSVRRASYSWTPCIFAMHSALILLKPQWTSMQKSMKSEAAAHSASTLIWIGFIFVVSWCLLFLRYGNQLLLGSHFTDFIYTH